MALRAEIIVAAVAFAATGVIGLLSETGAGRAQARADDLDEALVAEHRALGWVAPAAGPAGEAAKALEVATGVELLVARHGFELALGHDTVSGDAPAEDAVAAAAALVSAELARLPRNFLLAAHLRRVLLCAELHEGRIPIPSLPNYQGTLLLDAVASRAYLRRLVHHEVFHFADLADDDSVLRDPAWSALNPPGFAYAGSGRTMRDPAAGALGNAPDGFPSVYATSALEEDKAEVFALMMSEPDMLAARTARDAVLAAKVARIREITAALAPEMDGP